LEHPWNLFNEADGSGNVFASFTSLNLTHWLPTLITQQSIINALAWTVLILILNLLLCLDELRKSLRSPLRWGP
ncbi:MAG: hypothetical protein Q8Q33_00540, partial [Chlamydiota bacterium]|nr:hypothetical protein [Chlamydiota bacterium]